MKVVHLSVNFSELELIVRFDTAAELRVAADAILNGNLGVPKERMNEQIAHLMRKGEKIEAIRYHRSITGAYLIDSKNYVEDIGKRL